MNPDQDTINSKEIVEKLLGSWIICTLADGRTTEGRFACIDRLYVTKEGGSPNNIILTDCTERRQLSSEDYNEYHTPMVDNNPPAKREVTRHLRQAMVLGAHLVKVEIDEKVYQEKVGEAVPSSG
eukprot:scaffold1328_cov162-Amphora_coffeaeformis.AAC.20